MPTNANIEAFDAAGVDYEDILSIQRRLSSNTWVVAFRTAIAKEQVLSAWNFVIAGQRVFIADCDRKISLVKVYHAPNEIPDLVIIGRLPVYGSVLSFRRDLLTDSIFNGVRTARMEVACEQALPLKGLVTSQEKKSLQRSHSFFSILLSESERKLLIGQFV